VNNLLVPGFFSFIVFALFLLLCGCEKSNEAHEHNHDKKPLEFQTGTVTCPQCRMPLVSLNNSVQIITSDGKTWFFDDVGCMVLWIEENKEMLSKLVIWVYAHDTLQWVDAKKAYYSLIDRTPMRYGFGAYEYAQEHLISFEKMRLRMLRGLTLKDPKIRKHLLGI